jgi:isopropylmalate/homocitrate/citramalate synthase
VETASRANVDDLVRFYKASVDKGTDRIMIADSIGAWAPWEIGDTVKRIRQEVNVPIAVHCHNDLGMAEANALMAIQNGANEIHATVNGLGERTGLPDLATIIMNLHLRRGINRYDLKLLPRISQFVSMSSGIPIHHQAPVVGETAHDHVAGVHVSAANRDRKLYEVYPPELTGRTRRFYQTPVSGSGGLVERLSLGGMDEEANNPAKLRRYMQLIQEGKARMPPRVEGNR